MAAGSIAVPQIIPLRYALGQRKNFITSNTRIELKTVTKDCSIFYTLNSKKPDPFQKYGEKCTYRYKAPFTLLPGTVTIKALALSNKESANQSSVVTKVFTVQDGGKQEENIRDNYSETDGGEREETKLNASLSEQFKLRVRTLSRESLKSPVDDGQPHNRSHSPIPTPPPPTTSSSPIINPLLTDTSNHTPIFIPPSVVEKANALCSYCSFPRTPGSVYCSNCGSQLPLLPERNREAIRMGVCPSCRSEQPPDDSSSDCIVCSKPLILPPSLPPLKTQTEDKINTESILCLYCGTHNLARLSHCVTCANPLYPPASNGSDSNGKGCSWPNQDTIMHPITGSTYIMCDTCGRVNVSDARYCDWCGCRPSGSDVKLSCQNCEKLNDWKSRYCDQCGSVVKCPLRPQIEQNSKMRMPSGSVFNHSKWVPIADVDTPLEDKGILVKVDTRSSGTQTKGLFYPSANTIANKKTTEAWKKLTKKISQDKVLELNNYSPGNGRWRSQVDHICAHIRAYCSNTDQIQNDIGDYRMGKLIKMAVELNSNTNDGDPSNLTLNLSFALKDNESTVHSLVEYLSTATIGRRRRVSAESASLRRRSSSLPRPLSRRGSGVSIKVEDHLLITEVGPDGQGREHIVNSLVESGANVNLIDTTRGLPLLHLAVCSGHLEAVKAILQQGADANATSKKTGNSALHEAVKLQSSENSNNIIRVLLSNGANPNARNKSDQTPCELAISLGHKRVVSLFANHLGATMLSPLKVKPIIDEQCA